MALYTLVYVSSTTRRMTEDDLKQILESSRRNNPQNGITGILLHRDNHFMQALEGEQADVLALYRKINGDRRHRFARTLYEGRIDERQFGEWSMAFKKMDDLDPGELEGFADYMHLPFDDDEFVGNIDRVRMFLEMFQQGGLSSKSL